MKKDAYFFPHFSNARHDRKIKRIIKELGVEGYGIYFMLLEVLREQTDLRYPLSDIDLLADEFMTSEPKVRCVVCNYQLFDVDEKENFFSMKQIFYLQPYFEKSDRARKAAQVRWDKVLTDEEVRGGDANALQMQCSSNASKVKETKVNETIGVILDIYSEIKPPAQDNSRSRAKKHLVSLMKKYKPEDLIKVTKNYLDDCQYREIKVQFRKNSGNFFGKDATFEDYLDYKNPLELSPERIQELEDMGVLD